MATSISMDDSDQEIRVQQLKAAVHYFVGKICEEVASEHKDKKIEFTKPFIALLANLTYHQILSFAEDLELFAKHARRCVINIEDVKLLVRKSPALSDYINQSAEKLLEEKQQAKKRARHSKPSTSSMQED